MFGTVKNKCGLVRERETLKSNPALICPTLCPSSRWQKKGGGWGGGGPTNQSLIQGGSSQRYNPLPVILLPLCPASLMQEQSPKMQNNSWNASHRMQRMIDRFEDFLGRISCSCDYCGCFLKMHIHFYINFRSRFCALNIFLACNHVTRRPYWVQYNRIFPQII